MRFRRHKYGAKRTEIDGIKFDSRAEARRYQELKLREKAGEIGQLKVHPRYPIVHEGNKICFVELDFEYLDYCLQKEAFEDVKGVDTPMSRLKRKLIQAFYGIEVEVIR